MTSRTVQQIDKLARPTFWKTRWKKRRQRLKRSQRAYVRNTRLSDATGSTSLVWQLARRSWKPAAVGVCLFLIAELFGWLLAMSRVGGFEYVTATVPSSDFNPFVATSVAAVATFLGLFYTTVGVVASTAYRAVPSDIRFLFVEERTGQIYTKGAVHALIVGIILLVSGALGYAPRGLVLVLLALLTINAVLRLMILGGSLFSFFDPSMLSIPLPAQFKDAVRLASEPRTRLNEASQQTERAKA
ncbi:MAG: hypothetical protein JWQ19_74 [Subtercola sp.]|nr:hypothetical protein [Subtercola sp.]